MGNMGGFTCNDKEIRLADGTVNPCRFVRYTAGANTVTHTGITSGASGCCAVTDMLEFMDPIITNANGHYDNDTPVPCNFANDGVILLEAGATVGVDTPITSDALGRGIPAGVGAFVYGRSREATTVGRRFEFEPRHLDR